MPELTVIHIALFVITTVVGAIAGWVLRGNRSEQEKAAVSSGWQEQIDAQRKEHDRLLHQNKGLMEQVSQYQASNTDAKNRAKELSTALQEAFARRDELQREIKDIRSNLEVTLNQRDKLQSDIESRAADKNLLQQKDDRIAQLSQELENWQDRLPPLIERFRVRNAEAEQLESDLAEARERIRELESPQVESPANQTRIEPVRDPDELTDGLEASNDPAEDYVDEYETEDEEELVPDEELLGDEDLDDVDDVEEGEELDDDEDDEEDEDDDVVDEPEFGADDDDDDDDDDNDVGDEPDEEIIEPEAPDSFHDRDDLQMIKGVGPAIEKTLNELGIFRFRQIADMSEYDIDRVARKLKGFHSRIYREDWIGQARELLGQAAQA